MSVGFIVIDITFQVKLFEAVLPWKHENKELKTRVRSLGEELHKCCTELQNCKDVRGFITSSLARDVARPCVYKTKFSF